MIIELDRHRKSPTRAQVARAIERLPRDHQLLLSLLYCEGLGLSAIAQVLRQPESAIKEEHARAMATILDSVHKAKEGHVEIHPTSQRKQLVPQDVLMRFRLAGLTQAQSLVAALVCRGHSNKSAADLICVSEKAVKFHLTNIYKKFQVHSRAGLIFYARNRQIDDQAAAAA